MRRFLLFGLLGGCLVTLWCDDAAARSYRRRGRGGGGYGGVQTAASAAGHAMADIIRSKGMYNMYTSRAMVNVETARGKYIENQKRWTEVYQIRQRALQARHAEELEAAREKVQHYKEFLASNPSNGIAPLTGSQLNPATGQITWPAFLQSAAFNDTRPEIESLFAARALHHVVPEDSAKIHETVREMQSELRNHIHDVVTSDYMESRKFLDSLAAEGERPQH